MADDSDLFPTKPPAIAWSSGGDLILAGYDLFRVRDGKACALPGNNGAGFISAGRIVALALGKPFRFEIFNAECQLEDTAEADDALTAFADVSPERGLVSLLRKTSQSRGASEELVVVDPITKRIIQKWPKIETGYIARFADSGRILCTGEGGDYSAPPEAPPRCMEV